MAQHYEASVGRHIAGGPKYPNVTVQLSGTDGNAFAILGKMRREMRRKGVSEAEVTEFMGEAMSGDYDNLLRTCLRWVDVR